MILDRKLQFPMKLATWLFVFVVIMQCLAFAQTTTLNLSEDLVRLGIASTNMVPNQPSLDAGALLQNGVAYANNKQISRVIADPGSYYFLIAQGSCYVNLLAATNNLTVDFQGSDLYFADLSSPGLCAYGTGVTLQNFTIDYLKLPFTQLLVTSVNAAQKQIQLTVQPGWQKPSALNPLLPPVYASSYATVYIFRDGQPWPLSDRMFVQQPLADNLLTFTEADSSVVAQVRPGDIAVLYPANNYTPSITLGGPCKGCTLRNIRIYAGGEAPLWVVGESLLVERAYIIPKPGTDRLISGGGPYFQLTGPNNTFRLNRAIRELDEGFASVISFYGSVRSVLGSRILQVQGGAVGPSSGYDMLARNRSMPNGTPVEFQRLSDGAILGSAIVVSQNPAPAADGHPQMIVTFDRDLPVNLVGAYVYPTDPNLRGGNTLVERNTDQQRGFGTAFDASGLMNSALRGNYLQRSGWAGIWVNGNTMTSFGASPPPRNIIVSNNVIDGSNSEPGGVSKSQDYFAGIVALAGVQALELSSDPTDGPFVNTSPLQNITIANNFIVDSGRSAVWVGNTIGGSVSGNYFLNPNIAPVLSLAFPSVRSKVVQPLVVDTTSQNVTASNNTIDQTSGRMWVTDTKYSELAAYAPGSVIRLNAYNLGALANVSVTLTDADGNTAPAPIQKTAGHALDVQIPANAGLGGAYLTLTSGGTKYFGSLFLDSVDNIPALNGCTYEVSLSSTSVAASASSLPILVVTQAGCSYQVLATDTFVNPGGSATGTGVLSVGFAANTGGARTSTIEIAGRPLTLTQVAAPRPPTAAVVNGASFAPSYNAVAPGTIVAIFGTNLTDGTSCLPPSCYPTFGSNGRLNTTMTGAQVTFNGTPAPIFYSSPNQLGVEIPTELTGASATVQVTVNGQTSAQQSIAIAPVSPGIFTYTSDGKGAGAFTHVNGSAVTQQNPAHAGELVILYATGLGQVTPFVPSGALPAGASATAAATTLTIDNITVTPDFTGLAGCCVGLNQVNVRLPANTRSASNVPAVLTIGGVESNPVTIAVQ